MIVIVDPSASLRATIAEKLVAPDQTVQVSSLADISGALAGTVDGTRVVVLGPGLDRADALRYAGQVDGEHRGIGTLLLTEDLDPALLRDALRAGVDDVLTVHATPQEWSEAIERARVRVADEHESNGRDSDGPRQRGRVVTVFSTKGGCGKSLVASNLAVLAAAETDDGVALVDLDLQSGDLSIMFQLMPALSIFEAAQSVDQLDAEAMRGYLTPHSSGVSLLAAPMEPSMAEQVPAATVGHILEVLRGMFPLTIVDTPAMFTDQVLAAIDASDLIVLIGSMDVPSLKNLRLATKTLQQLGHPDEQVRIILNRADSKVGLRMQEVEKLLGARIDVAMPSTRDAPSSVNQGTPLAVDNPRSPIVRAIGKLLPSVLPADAQTDRRRHTARTKRR